MCHPVGRRSRHLPPFFSLTNHLIVRSLTQKQTEVHHVVCYSPRVRRVRRAQPSSSQTRLTGWLTDCARCEVRASNFVWLNSLAPSLTRSVLNFYLLPTDFGMLAVSVCSSINHILCVRVCLPSLLAAGFENQYKKV